MEVHTCTICAYKSTLFSAIIRHMSFHESKAPNFSCQESPPEPFSCLHCDFATDLSGVLRGHNVVLHRDKVADEEMEHFILRSHKCRNCLFETFSTLVMLKHAVQGCRTVARVKRRKYIVGWKKSVRKCSQCPFKTKAKSTLSKHKFEKHRKVITWYQCDYCSYKSKRRYCLKRHIVKHKIDKQKDYRCDECSKKFSERSKLERHLREIHRAVVEWFKCNKCLYKSKRKYTLDVHILLKHTKDEDALWYNCEQCKYKSKLKTFLRNHLKNRHNIVDNVIIN